MRCIYKNINGIVLVVVVVVVCKQQTLQNHIWVSQERQVCILLFFPYVYLTVSDHAVVQHGSLFPLPLRPMRPMYTFDLLYYLRAAVLL